MFCYCKQLCNVLEMPMLNEVNKVNKIRIIQLSSLFFHILFPPTPVYFDPPPI